MNITNLKNDTMLYLIDRVAESAKQNVYGYLSVINLDDLLVTFSIIEMVEDGENIDCAYNALSGYLNSVRSTITGSRLNTVRYVQASSSGGNSYRGSLANNSEAILAETGTNTDGDWWSISGDFTHDGVNYFTGEEVFWKSGAFEKSGNINPYAKIIVAPGRTSEEQDGNWRLRVDVGGGLLMEKRESGSWVTYQTIS
jgi:hypothetical protein